MAEMPGRIAVYDPAMAAKVAAMFNDFNELWPGGFGGGVPYTEQRVRDWLDQSSAIADLIALDADDEPVGYCGLYPHWWDPQACYVSILGVVPRVKGRKFGKRLLLRSVELAIEKGYPRLDLNTWPGNMDAVPLYKKTGLFWMPDTSVYMQNYLPALAQTTLGRAWFDRYPDWYSCFRRELTQAPDREIAGGMEVYTYRFVNGDDELVARADRYGWGLCSIASTLQERNLGAAARLDSHSILIGVPNALTIEIRNGTGADLDVPLMIEPLSGLSWTEAFPVSLAVPDGETATVTRGFIVDQTAKTYEELHASDAIRIRAVCDREVIDLVAGGKIQPAVEIGYPAGYYMVPPGTQQDVVVDIANRTDSPITGIVESYVESVPGDAASIPFALNAGAISGIAVPATLPDGIVSAYAHVQAFIDPADRDARRPMPEVRLPVVAEVPDLAVVVERNDGNRIHLLTDLVDVSVDLKGGRVSVGRRSLPDTRRSVDFQIGPPFAMENNIKYTYDLRSDHGSTLRITGDSLRNPGLRIDQFIRVSPGAREIEHWVTLTALKPGTTQAGGRLATGGHGLNLSLNPMGEPARFFTPVTVDGRARVVTCDAQLQLLTDTVVPQAPDAWPETWTAVQNRERGDLAAWIWSPVAIGKAKVSRGMLSSLESEQRRIGAGETFEVAHIWFGFGYTGVAEVRRRWAQLVGKKTLAWDDIHLSPDLLRPIEAHWAPEEEFVLAGQTSRKQIRLSFAVPVAIPGELSLSLPDGWLGSFATGDGPAQSVPMPAPESAGIEVLDVDLSAPESAANAAAVVTLRLRGEFEMSFDLPLIVAPPSGTGVRVERRELEGRPVVSVDNGVLSFDVIADAGGNLIHLADAAGHLFLHDSYPDCAPFFFVTYFVGGVQPMVVSPSSSEFAFPPEKVAATIVQEGIWRGVTVEWTVREQESLRGQVFAMTYLVAPGLGLVRVRLTHDNPTPRRFERVAGFMVFLNASLATESTTFTVPGGTQVWNRHPSAQGFIGPADLESSWAWVTERETGALGILGVSKGSAVPACFILGPFTGAFVTAKLEARPCGAGGPGRTTTEFALAVNHPSGDAEALLGALRGLTRSDL